MLFSRAQVKAAIQCLSNTKAWLYLLWASGTSGMMHNLCVICDTGSIKVTHLLCLANSYSGLWWYMWNWTVTKWKNALLLSFRFLLIKPCWIKEAHTHMRSVWTPYRLTSAETLSFLRVPVGEKKATLISQLGSLIVEITFTVLPHLMLRCRV